MKVKCSTCGADLERDKWKVEHYKDFFCSRKCKSEWMKKQPKEKHPHYKHGLYRGSTFICIYCGKERTRKSYKQKYCSTSCQLNYEYEHGIRDKKKITEAAHKACKKLIKKGEFGFQLNPPSWMKGRTKANGLFPEQAGFQKGEDNIINKYPEKHPNHILASKRHKTNIEKVMEKCLIKRSIKFIVQMRIGKYWCDFVIPHLNLIVECDGIYWHKEPNEERDSFLQAKGFIIHHWIVDDRKFYKSKEIELRQYCNFFLNNIL